MAPNEPTRTANHSSMPTRTAPVLPEALPPAARQLDPHGLPGPGDQIDDFKLLGVLGEGAFGKVFLAEQLSLERRVALKISANFGDEARTMASLEHDHIVQVFSETVHPRLNLRLLCMQYVAGATLHGIVQELRKRNRRQWNGRAILEIIDAQSAHPPTLDPAALRDREFLGERDFFEAACWIGARLAEALAYAHGQGVLHRDIKPANILINQYGRPMLVDFSVASYSPHAQKKAKRVLGGTVAYMAPEHLSALDPESGVAEEKVDERSDLYSLGVVLRELLIGKKPVDEVSSKAGTAELVKALLDCRLAVAPSLRKEVPEIPEALDQTIRRALASEPERRFQNAKEMAQALEGCLALREMEKKLPEAGLLTRAFSRRPFLSMIILAFIPHVLGSILNISYNALRIVSGLTAEQGKTFSRLVLSYNAVVYPLCLLMAIRLFVPAWRRWREFKENLAIEESLLQTLRRRILTFPIWVVAWSCLGWLPGGILFPLGIHWNAGPLALEHFGHFAISFTLSGLIALTYAYFGVQFVALRVFYPRLWLDAHQLRQTAAGELSAIGARWRIFQILAGLIPLAGAALLIGAGPEQFTTASYDTFRYLVTSLLILGMAGFCLSIAVTAVLTQTLMALTGAKRP